MNRSFRKTVRLSWIDQSGKSVEYGSVGPREERDQSTYVGHVWQVHDANGACVGQWSAEAGTTIVVVPE